MRLIFLDNESHQYNLKILNLIYILLLNVLFSDLLVLYEVALLEVS